MARTARSWTKMVRTLDLATVADEFLIAQQAEHSPKTARWYAQTIEYFLAFLRERQTSTLLADVGVREVREWIIELQTRPRRGREGTLSSHTINSWVRALRAFFNWLATNGYTTENRLKNLRPPKPLDEEIQILRPAQVEALLATCSPRTHTGCRNRAMLLLMLDAGLRLDEAAGVLAADVHASDGWLRVRGKGNKERVVPFGRNLQQVLIRYATVFRPESVSQPEHFLLGLHGQSLSGSGIESIVRRLGAQAGIAGLHPHLLRHTFATNYLLYSCGDALRLQQILGHTSLEMTRRYVHMAGRERDLLTAPVSPTDRLGISMNDRSSRSPARPKVGAASSEKPTVPTPADGNLGPHRSRSHPDRTDAAASSADRRSCQGAADPTASGMPRTVRRSSISGQPRSAPRRFR